jgi:predicted O-methyltransferase YrrM
MNTTSVTPHFDDRWPKIDAIEGWLDRESAALMDFMLETQDLIHTPGLGLLEVGVWKGRSAALMAAHLRSGEDLVLVDAWLKKDEIVANLSAAMAQRFSPQSVKLFQGTSRELGTDVGLIRRFRFVHIDGEHTGAGLRADLSLARKITEPTGLIAIDDIFHPMYPHLAKEMFTFLSTEARDLVCVMLGFNKAYLCQSRFLDAYSDIIFQRINDGMASRKAPVTLCRTSDRVEWPGYSVIANNGRPRRGPDFNDQFVRP